MSGPEIDRPRPSSDLEVEKALLALDPLIRGMISKRMHVTLRPDDFARDNQDALELYGEIWVELYRRISDEGTDVQDPARYTSRVVQHKFSDYIRKRYPVRYSVANSLRYFVENNPAYAIWESDDDTVCGFSGWRGQGTPD